MEFNKAYLAEDLEQLSTSKLKEMLREEVKKDVPSGPLVRSLLKILEARKAEYITTDNEEVEAACAQYRAYYERTEENTRKRSAITRKLALKAASVVLIIGFLFFTVPQMVEADQLQAMFKRWTESVFELFGPLYVDNDEIEYVFNTNHPGLQQLYDAVTEFGITDPVVPTWLPDGYELHEIKQTQSPLKKGAYALFLNGCETVYFAADVYNPEVARNFLKDPEEHLVYEYDGVQHNIIENDGQIVVIWSIENMGFSITADCQIEVLYKIIDSIYLTEDE